MIRTIIADNHALFRAGVIRLLRDVKAIDVVAEAESGEEAVDLTRKLNPHVVSLEIVMPGIGGLEAARRILRSETGTQVVMLTGAWEAPYPTQALRTGVCGFVTKRGAPEDVIVAIKRAYAGKRFVSADIAERLAFQVLRRRDQRPVRPAVEPRDADRAHGGELASASATSRRTCTYRPRPSTPTATASSRSSTSPATWNWRCSR